MTTPLREYKRKRDPSATPEPSGDGRSRRAKQPRFVVQEHHARRLHWDLRLEHDGVLASWAVPKGLPQDPDTNRLAVRTEDHPLEYLDFHGQIPAGQYGAGTMTIWDQGTYECEKWEERKLIVVFHGERVRGRYAIFRTGSEEKDWMIHRMDPPEERSLTASARKGPRGRFELEVEGRTLSLSNLDKVLYPASGFTKGDVIDFYGRIAPVVIPHLEGRPLTLKRYPNGVDEGHFYEKRCPRHRPEWVRTASVPSDRHGEIDYCVVEDLPTLVWAANLASLELHVSLSRAEEIESPTALVFDLDPGEPAGILDCCQVALWIRGMLGELGLSSYVKTSGSKGLHFYVPLNGGASYEQTKPFARAVAETLERRLPDRVVSRMTKSLRPGKVLVDWSQNDEHKTTVCVYSLRAKEQPSVSTPLSWKEVEEALESGDPEVLRFDYEAALERVERLGDHFAPLLTETQELPELPG